MAPCLDAVAGIAEFIAYALMVSEDAEGFSQNCDNLQVSYSEARGRLTSGSGIGQPCISAVTQSYNSHQVREALAILKDSGRMTTIIAAVFGLPASGQNIPAAPGAINAQICVLKP